MEEENARGRSGKIEEINGKEKIIEKTLKKIIASIKRSVSNHVKQ